MRGIEAYKPYLQLILSYPFELAKGHCMYPPYIASVSMPGMQPQLHYPITKYLQLQ